ncbi:MAG TPA: PspA/IM30 family protein [Candidatus Bipolaricaulota bacterium]
MGLISRFRNLFRAKAHAILDKVENPEQQLDYLYEQLVEQKKLAARAIRDATADRNLIRNELDEQRSAMQKAHDSAKAYRARALKLEAEGADESQTGRYNEVAKRLLTEFLKRQKRVDELQSRLEKAEVSVNTLKEKLIDLEAKIEDIRSRKEQLKSEWRMAKAEERISGSLAGFENDFSDMDMTLGRIEEKIKRKKALAQASTEVLADQRMTSTDPLDIALAGSMDTEAALMELDKELQGELALPHAHVSYFFIGASGGGTWALSEAERDEVMKKLNTIDNKLSQLNEKGQLTPQIFDEVYPQLFAFIRAKGKLVGRDLTFEEAGDAYLKPELKLPPEDLEFEEALKVFKGEGLFNG